MEVPHTRSATRATVTPTRQNQTRTTVSARPNDHVGQARNIEARAGYRKDLHQARASMIAFPGQPVENRP